jgi:SAM-dependent methyltransferase
MSDRVRGTENPDSWEAIYQTGDAGWDIGAVAPPFADLLNNPPQWLSPGTLLSVGCGKGHDAFFFAERDFVVTAADFAPSAVAAAREYEQRSANMTVEQTDILDPPRGWEGAFDYVLEHTCYCAIPPDSRRRYAEVVHWALAPHGSFFGLFYRFDPPDEDGPPHRVSEEGIVEVFSPWFSDITFETPPRSHGRRTGRERLVTMRRRNDI